MKVLDRELIIKEGSLEEAFNLKDAIFEALQGKANVKFTDDDFANIFNSELSGENIGAIADMLMSVISNHKVRESLFTLCNKCFIGEGSEKTVITKDFFEPVENRGYFYPVMLEVSKANIFPFFRGLNLKSLVQDKLKEKPRKSK